MQLAFRGVPPRRHAREGVDEGARETPNVGLYRDAQRVAILVFAFELLGGLEVVRPAHFVRGDTERAHRRRDNAGDAKVGYNRRAVFVDEDVRGLNEGEEKERRCV